MLAEHNYTASNILSAVVGIRNRSYDETWGAFDQPFSIGVIRPLGEPWHISRGP